MLGGVRALCNSKNVLCCCVANTRAFTQHADVAVNKILIGNKCDMDEDREVR